jgi:glutamate--cysteine ligase
MPIMSFSKSFAVLNANKECLLGIKRGIEKESLRIKPSGYLSQELHPDSLGSTLTHQYITTDYSEALLEFITPASTELKAPSEWLNAIHHFTYQHINDELLWNASMPCIMEAEEDIPIAYYGESNVGRMKSTYRNGLAWRYGRYMQTIAGVHYNFSLPSDFFELFRAKDLSAQDSQSEQYMALIRNYLRLGWIIPFLFGASPAMCKSFLQGHKTSLTELLPGTVHGQFATSLRMSDIGYQNNAQNDLKVSYNNLPDYIAGLEHAIKTSEPIYEDIGVKVNNDYRQLNTSLLQIENEYYSSIRPKRNAISGERPTKALKHSGVEYIEVRSLDINPFSPVGITQEQMAFIDVFLIYCSLIDSPFFTERSTAEIKENMRRVVNYGRDPKLCLIRQNKYICLREWLRELFEQMKPIAALLSDVHQDDIFMQSVVNNERCIDDSSLTLSGQLLDLIKTRGDSYFHTIQALSEEHKNKFRNSSLESAWQHLFELEAKDSLKNFKHTNQKQSDESFEAYVQEYFKD